MSANPDAVIAHVGLIRAVDKLLATVDEVRAKREALQRALAEKPKPEGEGDAQ